MKPPFREGEFVPSRPGRRFSAKAGGVGGLYGSEARLFVPQMRANARVDADFLKKHRIRPRTGRLKPCFGARTRGFPSPANGRGRETEHDGIELGTLAFSRRSARRGRLLTPRKSDVPAARPPSAGISAASSRPGSWMFPVKIAPSERFLWAPRAFARICPHLRLPERAGSGYIPDAEEAPQGGGQANRRLTKDGERGGWPSNGRETAFKWLPNGREFV